MGARMPSQPFILGRGSGSSRGAKTQACARATGTFVLSGSTLLPLLRAVHNVADSVARGLASVQYSVDLFGDRKLNLVLASQGQKGSRCTHAFGHHPHTGQDFGKRSAFA